MILLDSSVNINVKICIEFTKNIIEIALLSKGPRSRTLKWKVRSMSYVHCCQISSGVERVAYFINNLFTTTVKFLAFH